MVKFFFVTISLIFSLIMIALVLGIALIIYIFDSVAIRLNTTLIGTLRQPLRDFLDVVVDPTFVIIICIMILVSMIGFTSRLRPKVSDSSYRLQYRQLKSKNVTVALTAYNEESVITPCVKSFLENKYVKEVIVVDNNSTDNTSLVAEKAGAKVVKETKQGYGFTCMRGLNEALKTKSDVIVLCEGDNTQNGSDVDKFVTYIDNCDMVVGTRTVRALTEKGTQMSQFYNWGNYFIAFLIELKYFNPIDLTYLRLTDVGCTFRAIRRESLEKIIDKLDSPGHLFSPHMILVAIENDLVILEVPITFRKRKGYSKGAGGKKTLGFKVGLQMIWEIITR